MTDNLIKRLAKILIDEGGPVESIVTKALQTGLKTGLDKAKKVVEREIQGANETLNMDLLPRARESANTWLNTARGIFSALSKEKEEILVEEFYSKDEQRVVEYLAKVIPDVGAGGDPIGFLIASHNSLVQIMKDVRRT